MDKKKIDFVSMGFGCLGCIIQLWFCFSKILPFLLHSVTFYGKNVFVLFTGIIFVIVGLVLSLTWKKNKNTLIGIISNSVGLLLGIFNMIIFMTILMH